MLAYPHPRLPGFLVLIMAAYKPNSTIAPRKPQLVENVPGIGHTMQFSHRNPSESGTSFPSASVFESQPQAGQSHEAKVRSSWKANPNFSCLLLEKFLGGRQRHVDSIRPVSTRVEIPSLLPATQAQHQFEGNVRNSAIEQGDKNKGNCHSPRPEVGDETQGQYLRSPENETGDESKGQGDSPVTATRAEKVLKVREQLQIHGETITEMRDELKWLSKDLEYLNTVFSKWYPTKVTLIEELRQYPKKHFPRLFEDRLGELGGIGSLMSAFESKLAAGGFAEASNSRSSQLENSAQTKQDEDMLPDPNKRFTKLQLADQDGQGLRVGKGNGLPHAKKPRETHATILSGDALRLVKERVNIAMIEELRNLLRRDILPPLTGSVWPGGLRYRLRTQTTYEKILFQVLSYMYKFQLISTVEMRSFFETAETLEHTWLHLSRIYRQNENGVYAYHAFVPQMSFIAGNWQADHVGRCLADLQEREHCYLVHQAFRWTIEALVHSIPSEERTPESKSITEFFYHGNWFHNFLSAAPLSSHSEKQNFQIMKENIERSIKLFQNFPDPSDGRSVTPKIKQIEYLINFHMLHFFKTYGNNDVKRIFRSTPSAETFGLRFNMVELGLEANQLRKRRFDYEYILAYPLDLRNQIPCISSEAKIIQLKQARSVMISKFRDVLDQARKLTIDTDETIKLWNNHEPVKGILETLNRFAFELESKPYKENRNVWLILCQETVMTETKGQYESIKVLAQHLTTYFNIQYWYLFNLEFNSSQLSGILLHTEPHH